MKSCKWAEMVNNFMENDHGWIELAASLIEYLAVLLMVGFIVIGTAKWLFTATSGAGIAWGWSRSYSRLQLRIRDTQAELDRDIGSIRVAGQGDGRQLDRQMESVLQSVRSVVAELQDRERELHRSEQMAPIPK